VASNGNRNQGAIKMKNSVYFPLVGLILVGLAVSGCATLDKNECQNADWESIGYEDGARGYAASRIGNHRSACAKHGISPDLALYTKGRDKGLGQFCRANIGYRTGASGRTYHNVCPARTEPEFLAGYQYGQHVYKTNYRIRSLKSDIRKQEKLLDETIVQLNDAESELIRTGVSRARRAYLLDEVKLLTRKKRDHEEAIADAYHHLDRASDRLDRLQANNPYQ
jgi:hypothetical protein